MEALGLKSDSWFFCNDWNWDLIRAGKRLEMVFITFVCRDETMLQRLCA